MKKTILITSVFAVGAALADGPQPVEVVSSNAAGVLEVASVPAGRPVLVAVPFAGYGANGGALKVTELVSTRGLPEGTLLRAVKAIDGRTATYDTWQLKNGAWGSEWRYVVEVDETGAGTKGATPSADTVSLARGHAFWLELPAGTSGSFTMLGQEPAAGGSISLEKGKWNLVGNPGVEPAQLEQRISGATAGDQIVIASAQGTALPYTFDGKAWTKVIDFVGNTGTPPAVGAGQGVWIFVQGDATFSL